MKNRFFLCALFLLFGTTAFAQKNRVSLGYHSAYIIERGTFSKLGLQLSLERQLSPRWSVALLYSLDDYCRCNLEPYAFRRKSTPNAPNINFYRASPNRTEPSVRRAIHWELIGQYRIHFPSRPNQFLLVGTGLTYRSGGEVSLIGITWEAVVDSKKYADWAIPLRIAYRYDPPARWWGITAYAQYQGYFHYQKNSIGNAPMNVLHTGINFDFRWGKRESLKRKE